MANSNLPSVFGYRDFVDSGGLAYYGANNRVEIHRMADYVDRILNGTKPGDLPLQQPTTFELIVNLKTAKLLGLTVPPAMLASTDEVIE
jgi:putative ABC transport system substrate-binding protein